MSRYITRKLLQELRANLTQRDWQLISTLERVRVATAGQLEVLDFPDVTRRRARQKLTWLVDHRVLARLPGSVGGANAGSRSNVYTLDVVGQRLADLATDGRPGRPWALGRAFLNHSLAVTEVYVRLVLAERAGGLRVQRFAGEPGSWRSFRGARGARVTLKPDAYVVLVLDGYEDHWFLEMDLDTESAPTIARKCAVYRGYWQSGTEQARTGLFPRVLWLVPDERRAEVLRGVVRRQPGEAAGLFDVVLAKEVIARLRQGASE
jgi:Replication-relaxation